MEKEKQWHFEALNVHDSEDVVHPYELKVTNYLLETYPAIQFPVFPLMEMPKFSNFFKNLVTNTYADEFAENHFSTMVSRYSSGAFVPSAGTGFTLSREVIDSFGDEDVLPKDSLTEDYRLSLTLYQKGIQMYYPLVEVPRINFKNEFVYEFIATRSRFPYTFKTAVKQKTRWILGITMQSFKFREIFATKEMSFAGRYSLYRDFKAKIGNLLVLVGYPVLIYFFASLFWDLTPIYPKYSLSWYLCVLVTIMMLERQLFRAVAIKHVYGMRSVFFACLLPPILPIRFVYGNIINMVATMKAFKQRIFGNQTPVKKEKKAKRKNKQNEQKQLVWDKTEHHFLEKDILQRYHRKLGDVLLEKGFIEPSVLKEALENANEQKQALGAYLLEYDLISEDRLLEALANVQHLQYLPATNLSTYLQPEFSEKFNRKQLQEWYCLPILETDNHYVFAICDATPRDAVPLLEETYHISVSTIYALQQTILDGLAMLDSSIPLIDFAYERYEHKLISYKQLFLVRTYQEKTGASSEELLLKMGLLPPSFAENNTKSETIKQLPESTDPLQLKNATNITEKVT
jgi:adsorption protein B